MDDYFFAVKPNLGHIFFHTQVSLLKNFKEQIYYNILQILSLTYMVLYLKKKKVTSQYRLFIFCLLFSLLQNNIK